MNRKVLSIILLWHVAAGCTACDRGHSRTSGSTPMNSDVSEVLAILDGMPDWTSFSLNDPANEERARIERAVQSISRHKTDTIRSAVEFCQQRRYEGVGSFVASGKLYIVNNYLFDLPEVVSRESGHFRVFGGWMGVPVTGDPQHLGAKDTMLLRWPWAVGADGTYHLTGQYSGFMGESYDAIRAFDYYNQHFGRRETSANGK